MSIIEHTKEGISIDGYILNFESKRQGPPGTNEKITVEDVPVGTVTFYSGLYHTIDGHRFSRIELAALHLTKLAIVCVIIKLLRG